LLKKKKVAVAPEFKIQEATIIVGQQVDQFRKMVEEVEHAKSLRNEAIEELNKEIASLEAKLQEKKNAVAYAEANNKDDDEFIKRFKELMEL
jgi:septal ring factor EnvC (AmiA/AmiB activator)